MTKLCKKCGKEKELSEFSFSKGKYSYFCKPCKVKYVQAWQKKRKRMLRENALPKKMKPLDAIRKIDLPVK